DYSCLLYYSGAGLF
nr:immunoglobulin light chain junction region [Macaca mulatta]